MPVAPEPAQNPYACLGSIAVFFVIITPIYMMLRYFVKLIRWSYGFDVPEEDPGPPIRICEGCHNTVLELDYQHCPYCGRPLPSVPGRVPAAEQEAAGGGLEPVAELDQAAVPDSLALDPPAEPEPVPPTIEASRTSDA